MYIDEFDISKLMRSSINSTFDQREKYLIIALTGKTGSGCTTVADIFSKSLQEMKLSYPQPGLDGLNDDNEREIRLIQRYYSWHQKKFTVLKVRDVIISFLFENKNTWNRFCSDVASECKGKDASEVFKVFGVKNDIVKDFIDKTYSAFNNSSGETNKSIYMYVTEDLPRLGKEISNLLDDKFTSLFQKYGNELRFWGSLDPTKRKKVYEYKCEYQDDIDEIRKKRRYKRDPAFWPDEIHKSQNEFYLLEKKANTIFTIAERINKIIKILNYGVDSNSSGEKLPIAVVIDSMKNIYESNYLKDRYSAYYLISVTRDENLRVRALMTNQKKFTQFAIDHIDYNERPGESRRQLKKYVKQVLDNIKQVDTKETKNIDQLISYLKSIVKDDTSTSHLSALYQYILDWDSKRSESIRSACDSLNSNNPNIFSCTSIPISLCKYYFSILNDPLRLFLYISKLYPLYLQDVETCIQNSDIFLTNNESNGNRPLLKQNIIRYLSLMMHPGLVPPTQVERCMQIAYTAKVNSGCISRQVGAVVTDSNYQILSLNWNDVPCGQTSCVLRNLADVAAHRDLPAYSEYESDVNGDFQCHLSQAYSFDIPSIERLLNGLPASFCFKDINAKVSGSKNPMDARSMHGEEKALLQCDQQRVIGGYLFTTSSPCEMCAKNAKEHKIKKIYYIEPYPGISQKHICNSGKKDNRAEYVLFEGAIGRAYTQLYTPIIPYKDELELRGFPKALKK